MQRRGVIQAIMSLALAQGTASGMMITDAEARALALSIVAGEPEWLSLASSLADELDHLRARLHENIHRHVHPAQAPMRPLRPAYRRLFALRDDHEQVQVAALVGLTPRVRAEQPDLFRLKFRGQPPRHFIEQILTDVLHGRRVIELRWGCNPFSLSALPASPTPRWPLPLRPPENRSRRREEAETVRSFPR